MIVFGLDYSLFYLTDVDIGAQSLILKHSLSLLACITVKIHRRRFQKLFINASYFLACFDSWSSKFYCGCCGSAHTQLAFLPGPAENRELACVSSVWQHNILSHVDLGGGAGSGHLQPSPAKGRLFSDTGDAIVDPSCLEYQILSCLPSLGLLDRGLGFIVSSSSGTFGS